MTHQRLTRNNEQAIHVAFATYCTKKLFIYL